MESLWKHIYIDYPSDSEYAIGNMTFDPSNFFLRDNRNMDLQLHLNHERGCYTNIDHVCLGRYCGKNGKELNTNQLYPQNILSDLV